jgi:hypothetical protein
VSGYFVVGGQQREPRSIRAGQQAWHGYEKGVVVHADPSTGATTRAFEYASPPEVRAGDETAISFQAGALSGDLMYLCTETELLVHRVPNFERLDYVSLPCFNDVHHVRPGPARDKLAVANAGLEMVLEVTLDGEVLNLWNVLGEDPWERFDRSVDYRKVASTKPHRSHPNYVFYLGEDLWATRFHQGDAICLSQPGLSIDVSDQRIHDGVLHDGRLHFTTVDARIVIADAATLEVVDVIDLNQFHTERVMLGWCRALLFDGDQVWVGFSRIRPTRFRENVGWVARGLRRGMPTRIACYDLRLGEHIVDIDLEPAGLSAVYSILPAPPAAGESAQA